MILSKPAAPTLVDIEPDLVIRARSGDLSAQEELARKHRRPMFLLALQLLGNREDAMDVVQDSLLRFFTSLHRFDPSRPVRPWLYRIVRNRVIDLVRRRKVRRHESIDAPDENGKPRFELRDHSIDLEADVRAGQLRRQMWEALSRLSETQREILILRDYHDLAYAEIAETLDIPIGTVMSRLHSARKKLKQVLLDDFQALIH